MALQVNNFSHWDVPARIVGAAACSGNAQARSHNPIRWRRWSDTFEEARQVLLREFGASADLHDEDAGELVSADRAQHVIDELRRPAGQKMVAALDLDFLARLQRIQLFWGASVHVGEFLVDDFAPPRFRKPALVIVPFRDNSLGQSRWANLRNCLQRLRQQLLNGDRCVVVEADGEPRHEVEIRALGAEYDFVRDAGPFNKSKLINHGARTAKGDDILCILDSDTYFSGDFIDGAVRSYDRGALLPHENILFFTDSTSNRLREGISSVDTAGQFYVTGQSKGICVVVDQPTFATAHGFDERFEGWGGEDRDFVDRIAMLAPVARLGMNLGHLNHERPAMVDDGS